MRILSVNVGLPREVVWHGEPVYTSIFKEPVAGRVGVKTTNLDGDRQADLTVHGGLRKAVYVYPYEHYAFWQDQLPKADLPYGVFGENLTTEGLLEREVAPGDVLEIGSAVFRVTQPRMPCYKLQLRFDRLDMVKRFWRSGRCGVYLAVTKEGAIGAGDEIRLTRADQSAPTIAEIFEDRGRA